jgi:mRNA-degrading endonuclease RelE of RelBE toxin-antitoxin system
MLQHPRAWQALDDVYRRYRMHRFPYGVVYRVERNESQIVLVAVAHLKQKPNAWRNRVR